MKSPKSKRILCTVSNDLGTDQRMHRICNSLQKNGYEVCLIGKLSNNKLNIDNQLFKTIYLNILFNKGFLFYTLLNVQLFFTLLFKRADIICAVDLDTILPCLLVGKIKRIKVVYDAHEYFPESPEITHRPKLKHFWQQIEALAMQYCDSCYTVTESIAEILSQAYKREVSVIRNLPYYSPERNENNGKYLLYQGALNEGRGLEELLVAMKQIPLPLYLAGSGDIADKLKALAKHLRIEDKVHFLGNISYLKLKEITYNSLITINLLKYNSSKSYYYSLGNKTFDYIQAEVPSICIDFPEYRKIAEAYETCILVKDLEAATIVSAVKELMNNKFTYHLIRTNCQIAKKELCWEKEEKKLLEIYAAL
ncbi:MAG: glycosyltransferase [Chitinophagales bacterium]|nr:glycosyltransferase [Chitinophagales bacterium]